MRRLDFEWYVSNVDRLKTLKGMINALRLDPGPVVNFLSQEITVTVTATTP